MGHATGMARAVGLLLLGALAGPLAAEEAFRCRGDLVTSGDRTFEVRRLCGEPDFIDRYPEQRIPGVGYVGDIRDWYYNPGPNDLLRRLRFRDAELVDIAVLGKGYRAGFGGHCSPGELRRGLSKPELLDLCGPPDHTSHQLFAPGRYDRFVRSVEEWTYNFGSGRFMRHVRLVNGIVEDVELGNRGY